MISKLYEQRLRNDLFRLSIMTIVTVIIWIGVATYRSLSKSKISQTTKLQIKPLTATLDLDTIKNIQSRQEIINADWDSLAPQLPNSLVLTNKTATESGQMTGTLTATGSGEVNSN